MIKTRNLMFAAMSCIATMSLTSCATILSGSANKIYIDGDVDEPVTIVTEKQTYENVLTSSLRHPRNINHPFFLGNNA